MSRDAAGDMGTAQPLITQAHTSTDIAITKTGPAEANPDGTITYTLTVTNHGPSDAVSVTWHDETNGNLTTVDAFPCGNTGLTISCNVGTLGPGETATFTITLTVRPDVADGTVIPNCAVVYTGTSPDTNLDNNQSCINTIVTAPGQPTPTPTTPTPTTPTPTTPTPTTPTPTTPTPTTPTPTTPTPTTPTPTTPTPTTPTPTPAPTTPIPTTPSPTTPTPTTTPTLPPSPVLAVDKTAPVQVFENGEVAYRITVTNRGPGTATAVQLSDSLDSAFDASTLELPGGCSLTDTTITCPIGTLAEGESRTFEIRATASADVMAGLNIVNCAAATSTRVRVSLAPAPSCAQTLVIAHPSTGPVPAPPQSGSER